MRRWVTAATIRAVIATRRADPVARSPATVIGAVRFVIAQPHFYAIVVFVATAGDHAARQ
jgi:hypothetical protein